MIGAISSATNHLRTVDLINHFIQNGQIKINEKRKDVRKKFNEPLPIVDCQTKDGNFKASINSLSPSGVFIRTGRHFSTGQEIAMTFPFPISKNTKMVTGEVVRISGEGIGVVFKIFFRK